VYCGPDSERGSIRDRADHRPPARGSAGAAMARCGCPVASRLRDDERLPPRGRSDLPASTHRVRDHTACHTTVRVATRMLRRETVRQKIQCSLSSAARRGSGHNRCEVPRRTSHRERQAVERARAGESWREEDWVFTNRLGGPVHPTVDYDGWKALLRAARVRTARLHDVSAYRRDHAPRAEGPAPGGDGGHGLVGCRP
jgi:hypothetical protein